MRTALLSEHRFRKRAALAAGGAVALSLSVAFLHEWQQRLSDQQARVEQEIGRTNALLEEEPYWRSARTELEASALAQSALISAANDSLAAASLQTHIVDIVRDAGGIIRSVQSLPVDPETDRARLGVNIDFTVNSQALVTVLQALETSLPLVTLANTRIRGASRFGQNGDLHPVDIHVQTRVDAFLKEIS